MLGLTLETIENVTGGKYFGNESLKTVSAASSVEIDSRKCTLGSLFIAIKGERTDGHEYVNAAYENGAVCVIAEKELNTDKPYILVENSVTALQKLAAYYRKLLGVKVVGITGSVGKTTCKEVVASVLSQKYNVLKTKGNFNNEIGLPLTLLSMTEKTEAAVIEMGMSDFGEMSLLSSIARPDLCVITNIGHSHMENLGSQEGILKAKSEIFDYMTDNAAAFLNGDDELLRTIQRPNIHYFGERNSFPYGENDIHLKELLLKGFEGSEGIVDAFGKEMHYETSIPGRHILYAVTAAIGIGLYMGLSESQILNGIKSASTIDGRVNIIQKGGIKIIDDCYNAAPSSMKAGICLLTDEGAENTVAILGDMGELGENAAALHRDVGEFADEHKVEIIICIGELAKNIFEGCSGTDGRTYYFETKAAFMEKAAEIIPQKCNILIKASHFMNFSEIVEFLQTKV